MPRTALVTGANRGIGLEFTRQLLARGERVIACCRQPGKASDLNALAGRHPGRLSVLPLDVARQESRTALLAELPLVLGDDGRLDLLLHNAGVLHSGERFGQLQQATLEDSLQVNLIGPWMLSQALAPWLRDTGIDARSDASTNEAAGSPGRGNKANIVERLAPTRAAGGAPMPDDAHAHSRPTVIAHLSSQLGSIAGVTRFGAPSYAISKAAQNMASAQLAKALAPRGIVVLSFHPGWVQTAMGGPRATDPADTVVAGMLKVIDAATAAQSGSFLDWQGQPLPW